jgi:IclR family transcriptional regulator, acetate operon repressor
VIAATSRLQYSSAVRNKPHKAIQRPAYLLESVDNALRLLQMLRDVGAVRLNQAAAELGIARSTAHRLLAMLVYRGFAVQDEKRTYHPGPAMGAGPAERGWTREFTDRCRPHLEALVAACGETVNLVIRTGTQVRFLATVESDAMLRVGDRQGQVLPAELTSGGRSLLAELPDDVLQRLYLKTPGDDELDATDRRLDPAEFDEFRHELTGVRRAGFAVNVQQTEEGVAAFGMSIHNHAGRPIGAISVSVPTVRYQRHAHGQLVAQMKRAVREMELDVADIEP